MSASASVLVSARTDGQRCLRRECTGEKRDGKWVLQRKGRLLPAPSGDAPGGQTFLLDVDGVRHGERHPARPVDRQCACFAVAADGLCEILRPSLATAARSLARGLGEGEKSDGRGLSERACMGTPTCHPSRFLVRSAGRLVSPAGADAADARRPNTTKGERGGDIQVDGEVGRVRRRFPEAGRRRWWRSPLRRRGKIPAACGRRVRPDTGESTGSTTNQRPRNSSLATWGPFHAGAWQLRKLRFSVSSHACSLVSIPAASTSAGRPRAEISLRGVAGSLRAGQALSTSAATEHEEMPSAAADEGAEPASAVSSRRTGRPERESSSGGERQHQRWTSDQRVR